ncbi:MAG: type II toxin-antitoxin system HicA family toxin [Pseudomonas piscis]|uniref:type II toxin-antitoxin system HicA family toxin n=1 Tax=Pseudomonas piscis TaxID=2614538 RepID=UPI003D2D29E3
MSRPPKVHERLRHLVEFAISNGWAVSRSAGGHLRFKKTGCSDIYTSATPGDHRSERNARARLRRADRTTPFSKEIS